jgi:8-oxo-dGTP pyrophosphatase MutT (NUDIX family)
MGCRHLLEMLAEQPTRAGAPLFRMRATLTREGRFDIDLEWLRRHFASADPPPTSVYGDLGARREPAALTPASVLVPIVARNVELTVLFTERTTHLRDHSGQVSFPGGRCEPRDPSPEATALRETQEEIGLHPRHVELLGRLPEYRTGTGFRVTPVVGIVRPPFELRRDEYEVERVFEVPLSFLLDPANHQRQSRLWQGETRWFFAIPYGEHYIWGATAGMLVNLYRYLTQGLR